MSVIGSLAVNIVARTDQLTKGLGQAKKEVKGFDRSLQGNIGSLRQWHGHIVAASGALGLGFMIRQQLREIDALGKMSDRLGVTTKALGGLHHAAELSGVGVSSLNMGLQRMIRRVSEAARGTGEAVGALQELGLSAQHLTALSPEKQFGTLADALNRVQNQADKVRLAMKLFDSEGVALLQMTQNGSKGLAAMADEAERFGKALDRIDVKKVEELNAQWTRLSGAGEGLLNRAITMSAPLLTTLLEAHEKQLEHMSLVPAAIMEGISRGAKGRGGGFSVGAFSRGFSNAIVGDPREPELLKQIEAIQARLAKFEDPEGNRFERLTAPLGKAFETLSRSTRQFNEKLKEANSPLNIFKASLMRGIQAAEARSRGLAQHKNMMDSLQAFAKFGKSLSFTPQHVGALSSNAALEAGTREAFIAQRGGRNQLERERTKLMKQEVNFSKEIAAGIKGLLEQGRQVAKVISIPGA